MNRSKTDGQQMMFSSIRLPCGAVIRNRLAKSAMSDSLGDGRGHPTDAQVNLYREWAKGGVGLSIIGEVQGDPNFAEKPGNLVLQPGSDPAPFRALAGAGSTGGAHIWPQLGHAGAMAFPPISTPKGPSALSLPGLECAALTADEIAALPGKFADTARLARDIGFGGVEIHAAHGFLLSQFLSPLFNQRSDAYGGSLAARMRLTLEVIDAVRRVVGPEFPIGIKLNATDQIEGGFDEDEALDVISVLDKTSIDLIDISGGTYFPGAKSASDSAGGGPYFRSFARKARSRTDKPLMLTGGFKTFAQAADTLESGDADLIGLARPLILDPALPLSWQATPPTDPAFPRFAKAPEGGVTAWYTMRLTQIAEEGQDETPHSIEDAMSAYDNRDRSRTVIWNAHFGL